MARLRGIVERDGGVTVGCDDLEVLCPDEFTLGEQFTYIATIAHEEGWSFVFLEDGSVRFGGYIQDVASSGPQRVHLEASADQTLLPCHLSF
jgi:hypothetical protein